MTTQDAGPDRLELLQGTLDVLILRTLELDRQHGQGIAREIQDMSGDSLLVDHGSLYPALKRLEKRKWIAGEWGVSSNNRRARFYSLTPKGRKQLTVEVARWHDLVAAMARVLGTGQTEG